MPEQRADETAEITPEQPGGDTSEQSGGEGPEQSAEVAVEEPVAEPPVAEPPVADERLLAAHDLARTALLEITPEVTIGPVVGHVVEGEHVLSLLFECTMLGYPGWHWTVSLARVDADAEPVVLETELLPGERALLAPDWVPWSERLAEYQAAQEAARAAGVEGEASEGESAPDDDLDEDDDLDDDDLDDEGDLDEDDDIDGIDIDLHDEVESDDDTDDVDVEADDIAGAEAASLEDDEDSTDGTDSTDRTGADADHAS